MEEAEICDVSIEWICPNCGDEEGQNTYSSDNIIGIIEDKCENCGEKFRLN